MLYSKVMLTKDIFHQITWITLWKRSAKSNEESHRKLSISVFVIHCRFISRNKCYILRLYSSAAIYKDPNKASKYLLNLNPIQNLLKVWRFKANEIVEAKSNRVTCTRIAICPVVYLNGIQIPWAEVAKYFGIPQAI